MELSRHRTGAPAWHYAGSVAPGGWQSATHRGDLRGAPGLVRLLTLVIRIYQLTISPAQTFLFGAGCGCRFTPTCSAYAAEALREHGVAIGTMLSAKRICRCHPWGGCGHDPVPKRNAASMMEHPKECPL